ncbi:DUF599 domain-containing protein [Pelagibius sp. Alg239-R121]|uniref:DUF599 domain-containing protein n=1 Tax=Pelagibius sp. Alg239-R121 TaxID=2993448 RepID=UPI0024A7150F|nr:DUF599 domain-containing protein [Pelagibius sp. Alg239-R121]
MNDVSTLDYISFAWFLFCWFGYAFYVEYGPQKTKGMYHALSTYRRRWMFEMLKRENRILDSTLMGNLLNAAVFFASTSIFVVGGLIAVLGATDQVTALLDELPVDVGTTRWIWEAKILILVTIFIYGFFKFAWSVRLFNYCSILIGATPMTPKNDPSAGDDPERQETAEKAGRIIDLASQHFQRGMRAYFFGLAALGWLVHSTVFIVACTWVVLVLYRRDFHSRSLRVFQGELD